MGFFDLFTPTVKAAVTAAHVDAANVAPFFAPTGQVLFGTYTSATRIEAMTVPSVARALNIIQTIGSLPLHTRNEATGEKVSQPRVINQPDPRIPGSTFWAWLLSDLFFFPNGYARVLERYADTGKIRAMERVAPERVTIQLNAQGTDVTNYMIDGTYIDPETLVVFPGTQEGLLSRAGRTINAAAALERAALDFAVDPIPQMVVKSNGTSLPADRVSKLLSAIRNRVKKSVIYLNADVDLSTIGYDPKNLQLNEARNYLALELSRACGLPAYFLDAQQSSFTYSNALDKRRDLVDFAFRSYMSIIEQRLSFPDFTPAGNRVSFDLDDFLRGNPYERAQVYEILNRIGAMSIDEIREEEDMLL